MIPWTLEDFMKVLIGMGTSEESRLDGLLRLHPTGSPSFKTNQRLFDADDLPRRSTYESRGLGFVHEFMSSERFQQLPESLRYSDLIELTQQQAADYSNHHELAAGTHIYRDLLFAFPRLLSSIICIEAIALGESKRQPIPDFPAKKSAEEFRLEFDQFAAEKKQSVFELHSFVLYMAAVELDIAALEGSRLMPPACFVTSYYKKSIRYPMETFWEWLKSKAGYARWTDFADAMETTPALLSKYRKARSLDTSPSYKQLREFCHHLWPQVGLGRRSQRVLEVTLAYGMARVMQEHAHRCVPVVIDHYCDEAEIDNFYLKRINECKKWVQEIPLHPCFKAE